MFGRRKREEAAAAEAVREAERRALFTRLAERPEHICPFLGLAGDRTEYIEGVSDEHRCFAFGDPAMISAEQQTRVCQERGYGNCPRYLRGVLVIPTEELEALRRPMPRAAAQPPPPPPTETTRRRRGAPILLALLLLLLVGGGVGTYLLLARDDGVAVVSPSASVGGTPSAVPTPAVTTTPTEPPPTEPPPSASPSGIASPTLEPTPDVGDAFAFYEVSVGPEVDFNLYRLDAAGQVSASRVISFDAFSFARAEPVAAADGSVYWVTQDGDLAGWGYTAPASGPFRIRAVFLSGAGERRSEYLVEGQLGELPEETPAP